MDESAKEKTFINKRISYLEPQSLQDIIVIEIIPKTIAENVNEVNFLDQKYEALKEDPIVKFGFLEFDYQGEDISYTLDKKIEMEELKNTKSIVLLNLNTLVQDSSKITGFSIFSLSGLGLSKTNMIFLWVGVITILALSGYYLLFVRDYKRNWEVILACLLP